MTAAILQMLPKPRGRRPDVLTGAEACLHLFPNKSKRTYIYAIAFKGGVVKVGRSASPRSRLKQHWTRGSGEVLWVHLFPPMHARTARSVEISLPRALAPILTPVNGSEWMRGATERGEIVARVREVITNCRADMQRKFNEEASRAEKEKVADAALAAAGITGMTVRQSWQWNTDGTAA